MENVPAVIQGLDINEGWNALKNEAKGRWLNAQEVYHVLTCYTAEPSIYQRKAPPRFPPSGSLFLYNRKEVKNYKKKDAYPWIIKRGTKNATREDYLKLIVDNQKKIVVSYTRSSVNPTFNRRCYRLSIEEDNNVLVHYLDTKLSRRSIHDHLIDHVRPKNRTARPTTTSVPKANSKEIEFPGLEELSCFPRTTVLGNDLDAMVLEEGIFDNTSPQAAAPDSDLLSPSTFTESESFSLMEEVVLPDLHTSVVAPQLDVSLSTSITDFSPNWDFSVGGAKVLVCLANPLPTWIDSQSIKIQFGSTLVSTERISDSVLRCTAPPLAAVVENQETAVEFCVVLQGVPVIVLTDSRKFFYRSYRDAYATTPTMHGKRKTEELPTPTSSLSVVAPPSSGHPDLLSPPCSLDREFDQREFKIRVVEKLSEFQKAITDSSLNDQSSVSERNASSSSECLLLDDSAVAEAEDQDLEILSEELIKKVVQQLVTVAETREDLLEELNSLDDIGLSLLHYVCFYNYVEILPLLLSRGANVNQPSSHGYTPLHLAAGCGHRNILLTLLDHGANAIVRDYEGYTAADRAELNYHSEIATYLRTLDVVNSPVRPPSTTSLENEASVNALPHFASSIDSPVDNRKMLLGAFSSMSLHDKCALSLSISREPSTSTSTTNTTNSSKLEEPLDECNNNIDATSDVASVMTENDAESSKLNAAMKLMAPEELATLTEEATVIQQNVRAWLLRRSYKTMRDATRKLQEAASEEADTNDLREQAAAVTVQSATRTMLARKSYLQQRNIAIRFQAATRGVLCRKKFSAMKKHALASLVIQRNIRAWLGNSEKKRRETHYSMTA